MSKNKIVLASASKRRSQILNNSRIKHKIILSKVKEVFSCEIAPAKLVIKNAVLKADDVARNCKDKIVIGADTLVFFDGQALGKPKDAAHAKEMLKAFRGQWIKVYTGLCIIDTASKKIAFGSEQTQLKVKEIADKEINKYFKLLGPYDKAGGFSIEGVGAIIFDNLKGSYFNVLGLPMGKLEDLFEKIGLDLLDFVA